MKPEDRNVCFDCIDIQIKQGCYKNCEECSKTTGEFELVRVYTDIFGRTRAIIASGVDRILKTVPVHRIFDVREKENVV